MNEGTGLSAGIDVGTSSICVALWDGAAGRLLRVASRPNESALRGPAGRAEQDPEVIWGTVVSVLGEAAESAATAVGALACTGQMHGILFVDESLRPVSPLVTWQDRRAEPLAADANAALDRVDPLGWTRRGCRLHPGYGALTLSWFLEDGGIPSSARWACTIADWIAARLSGSLVTDPTEAASWGILDLGRRDWDAEAIRTLGIPAGILPPVRKTGTLLGRAGIPELGLAAEVACGLGDNQASVMAAIRGLDPERCCVVNVGTGSQISLVAGGGVAPSLDPSSSLELRPFGEDGNLYVGASLNGGAAYAALRDLFAAARGGTGRGGTDELYELMGAWAAVVGPGCDGLACAPWFFGERGRDGLTGSLTGITAANLTPAHLCRAVLEGMARTLHDLYRATGISASTLVGSGNAVRRGALLREILSSTFGSPLRMSPYTEEAAVGAALVASQLRAGSPLTGRATDRDDPPRKRRPSGPDTRG